MAAAIPLLGLDAPAAEVDALFDTWDPDGSGSIDFKELQKILRGGASEAAKGKWKETAAATAAADKLTQASTAKGKLQAAAKLVNATKKKQG